MTDAHVGEETGPAADGAALRWRAQARAAWFVMACACVACACAAAPRAAVPDSAPPISRPAYDWQPLILAPFGTRLADMEPMHEVLLFDDRQHVPGPAEAADCHAPDGPLPQYAGRSPDEFLLCFRHDRLRRLEVTVHLEAAEAAEAFARACAASGAAAGGSPAAGVCEGRIPGIAWNAHLDATEESAPRLVLTVADAEDGAPAPP